MACKTVCFDCPFTKFADKGILYKSPNEELPVSPAFDFWIDHMTPEGGYAEMECEEQGDTCFGQIQVLANGLHPEIDPFSDFGETVEETKPDKKDFFAGSWEFLAHHDP